MTPSADPLRPVRLWLWAVALLVAAMVMVGGATRLTESGLSITEWRPVTGAVPPLTDAAWQAEFEKYRQIPQYTQVNRGMSLGDFKTIYFWEWGHRLLGRIIGFAFALPLAFFSWTGRVRGALAGKLLVLLALGGLQGAVGWWMVASGLVDRVSVAPYRLATHLTLAFAIFAALIWTARSLRPQPLRFDPGPLRGGAILVLSLVFVQAFVGAIVAGLDAGLTFNTWPLMDGAFVPEGRGLFAMQPLWRNLFENPMAAQFAHRLLAYVLLAAALWHAWQARRSPVASQARVLATLILLQAVLGIATLIHVVPIHLALAHQLGALAVIGWATTHVQAFARPQRSIPAYAA